MEIHRRTFLRGMGGAIALPGLEAMLPGELRASGKVSGAPKRLAFVYAPNGAMMDPWRPKGEGKKWDLGASMAGLKKVKNEIQVITGLAHDKAKANGDGAGDHARATATFLTGMQARKTAGADIRNGVSVDQIAAAKIGRLTRLPSLQLGCDPARQAGRCDSGYSCAYQFNFSWKTEAMPLPPEIDPRLVFEQMFGSGDRNQDAESRKRRMMYDQSILDFVLEDAKKLQGKLGYSDRQKMDEYLTGVRELEQKIVNAEKFAASLPDVDKPTGIPALYKDHIRMMYDLMVLAFQSDTTRIATFLVAHDGSNRNFKEFGVSEGHHQLSHHRNDQAKMKKIAKIDRFYIDQFGYFLEQLKAVKEADGSSLLDNSMVVFGGAISDGNRHNHDDLPVILAGKGGGELRAGRHLKTKQSVPMANMYLSLLDRVGVKEDRLGDSTGRFDLI
ncbi:MAG: DUF1552 domain-containing protein [Verrucomicrobia bacterium]|nr:DUF1552 domain-containing protein [Verrucomicrobiota bacterium]